MNCNLVAVVALLASTALASEPLAQTPPPAPVLVAPANGAAAVQPIALRWQPIVDPRGPIGSYSWQISTNSTFGAVIAAGFNNFAGTDVPISTETQVSGLANGTYFWRVKGAQDLGGVTGFIDSLWSAPRSFTVTGLGPAPGIPTITSPGAGARFHPFETFDIVWTEVVGAHHYILEADEDAGFLDPINLSGGPVILFGTRFHAGWGNEIPNVNYRVRAVSADNVWGRPSTTLTVHITNTAPVVRKDIISKRNAGPGLSTTVGSDSTKSAKPHPCTAARPTVAYRVHWLIRFRPSSSFCIFSTCGNTAPAIWTKMLAEMYGMMPNANTVDRENWPPVNKLYKPSNPFAWPLK